MLRIVADTNILISALGWQGNEREILNHCLSGKIKLIESQSLLDELIEVLKRGKFDHISIEKKSNLLETLTKLSEIVNPNKKIDIIKEDPKDNTILEAAIDGGANYIVTGDEHLLRLKVFNGIRIINSEELLKILS